MISAVRFSPPRTFVTTKIALPGLTQRIRTTAFSTRAFQSKQTFSHHSKPIQALAVDSEGKFLISGCAAGKIVLQKLDSDEKPVVLNGEEKGKNEVTFVSFLPIQRKFVGGMAYGTMTMWDQEGNSTKLGTRLGRLQRTFQTFRSIWGSSEQMPHLGDVNGVVEMYCSLRKAHLIVSASQDETIKAWDSQKPEKPLFTVGTHRGSIYSLAVCNENRIASASEDGKIQLWNPFLEKPKDRLIQTLTHTGRVLKLLFLPEQNTLLSKNESNHGSTIKAWDLSDAEAKELAPLSLEADKILSWAPFPKGTLALGYRNGEIRLWNSFVDPKNPSFSVLPHVHKTAVKALAVLADGSLVSGGEDGVIHRWVQKPAS